MKTPESQVTSELSQVHHLSPCPQFSVCGSCSWSDIPYPEQLSKKKGEIIDACVAHGVVLPDFEVAPSPRQEHYRNRMDFVIGFKGQVGLRERGKWWKIIDNHTCMVSDEKIEEAFHSVRVWVAQSGLTFFDRKKHTGFLRYAVIRYASTGERLVTIVTSIPVDGDEHTRARTALETLAQQLEKTTVVWSQNSTVSDVSFGDIDTIISGSGSIHEVIDGTTYRISPHAFFQTNSHASPLLLQTVASFCGDYHQKKIVDLYCGTGFFGVALARHAQAVVGVELSTAAIHDARQNAELNGVSIEFHDAKAEQFSWLHYAPDIVIIDPPRSGLHPDVIKDLIASKVKHIVYVSCNFKRLAEEMKQLGQHYSITRARAIDLFPHTPHVEFVVALELR
jgi:23S rRNA (uracil-5-)-methyltransferase RumA